MKNAGVVKTHTIAKILQIDKQNNDKQKSAVVSQNITTVHPSLNHYHVSLVLVQNVRARVFSYDTKNRKNLRILFESGSQMTFISEKGRNQMNWKRVSKQNISKTKVLETMKK